MFEPKHIQSYSGYVTIGNSPIPHKVEVMGYWVPDISGPEGTIHENYWFETDILDPEEALMDINIQLLNCFNHDGQSFDGDMNT